MFTEKVASLLPRPINETCEGEKTMACYDVHMKNYPDRIQSTDQKACRADGLLPDKSPLITDVPLNSKQLAMEYNIDPPLFDEEAAWRGPWRTQTCIVSSWESTSPRYRGKPHVLSSAVILSIYIAIGVCVCYTAIPTLVANYDIAHKLMIVQMEALEAVITIDDINNIPADYEGKLIHVTGLISVDAPLIYKECGISVRSIKVKRIYDLSRIYSSRASKHESRSVSSNWLNVRIGNEHLCESSVFDSADVKMIDEARIGPLVLGHRIKEKFDEYYVITEKVRVMENKKAVPVIYADTGRNGTKYSVMGQLVNGRIEPYGLLDYYNIILLRESEVSAEKMIMDRTYYRKQVLFEENFRACTAIGLGITFSLTMCFCYYRTHTMNDEK